MSGYGMDMVPETVQENAMGVLNDIKTMREESQRLKDAINSLDEIWISNEKATYVTGARASVEKLDEAINEFERKAQQALTVANNRVERENRYTA